MLELGLTPSIEHAFLANLRFHVIQGPPTVWLPIDRLLVWIWNAMWLHHARYRRQVRAFSPSVGTAGTAAS